MDSDLAWVMVRALDKADAMLTLSSAVWNRRPFTILPFYSTYIRCICNNSVIYRTGSWLFWHY